VHAVPGARFIDPRVIPPDILAKAYRTCESLSEVLGILKTR
jgi:hypothetical protein